MHKNRREDDHNSCFNRCGSGQQSVQKRSTKRMSGLTGRRLLTWLLALTIVLTQQSEFGRMLSVRAGQKEEDRVITGFASLSEETARQEVPFGTQAGNLDLPDTLEASVLPADEKMQGGEPPEDSEEKEDGGKNPADDPENSEEGENEGDTGENPVEGENEGNTGENPVEGENEGDTGENPVEGENEGDAGENPAEGETDGNGGEDVTENPEDGGAEDEDRTGSAENAGEGETEAGNISGTPDTQGPGERKEPGTSQEKTEDGQGAGADRASAIAALSGGRTGKRMTPWAAPVFTYLGTPVTLLTANADGQNDDGRSGQEPDPNGEAGTDDPQSPESIEIKGVTWESAPSYDGEQPGDYVFTAVLPEGYETAQGVALPRITVTVMEEVLEEETSAAVYASMPVDEVAPLAERAGTYGISFASADNAGDRYRVRVLWQTVKTVSKNATAVGCEKSWVAIRVPGISGDQKMHFNKEMLTDSSKVYTIAELTLPYTYEDRQDIFPSQLGVYSALSLISGQFKGRVTLQAYDYIRQEWESYIAYDISPEAALVGGIISEKSWHTIEQPDAWAEYMDIDREDLYIEGAGWTEKSWDLVFADNFGVVLTEKSRGWSGRWELKREDESAYPSKYQISLDGNMEGLHLVAASGVNGIPAADRPWACVTVQGLRGSTSILRIGLGINTLRYRIQYLDAEGAVYSEVVPVGSAYRVADVTKAALNQGRDIVLPKGHGFAGTYTGSDEKSYRPGDEIAALEEPINFYMQWEPKTYRVTLDGQIDKNGERTLLENGRYEMEMTYGQMGGETAPIPPQAPDKYRFNGWIGEVDGEKVLFFDKDGKPFNKWRGDENTVLTPRWALSNINYVFYPWTDGHYDAWCCQGGYVFRNPPDEKRPTMAQYGAHFPRTEEEVYCHGYDLLGWYDTPGGEGIEYDDNTPLPLEDTCFYARWTPKKTTLTLDANGGSFEGGSPTHRREEKVSYGQKFGEIAATLPVPSRAGYDLVGWGYSKSARVKDALEEEDALEATADFTLYAIWGRNDITIYLDAGGGSFANPADARVKAAVGKEVTLQKPARKGYTFTGWRDAAGTETKGTVYMVPEDAGVSFTLTAVWQANTYKLNFNTNGGIGSAQMPPQTLTYDRLFNLPENKFTRGGYTFAGWNTERDGSGTAYKDEAAVKNLAESGETTLYAQWTPVTCSVSFDPNGGAFSDSAHSSKTVTYGAAYGALPVPVRDRYDFKGWFTGKTGGTQVGEKTVVENTAAHTLYARWEYAWFTLSFDLRGGSGSRDCAFGNMEGRAGEGITLPQAVPERAGWEFKGWSATQGQTPDTGYEAAAVLGGTAPKVQSEGKEKVTLYAVWYSPDPFVSYDANVGGTGDTVTNMPAGEKFKDGKVNVSAKKPSRTGYTFMGWALAPDGQALYKKPGETQTETICSAVSVTLYAVWQAGTAAEAGTINNNYECRYFKDGKWQFTTLKTALAQVPEGGEIVMLKTISGKDAENQTGITYASAKSCTLNLNRFELNYSGAISFTGGRVTVKNGYIGSQLLMKKGAQAVIDGVWFSGDNSDNRDIRIEGIGTRMTMQGQTVVLDRTVRVGSGTTVHVKYAEFAIECKSPRHLFEVDGGSLIIDDGYFYCVGKMEERGSETVYSGLITTKNSNPASSYELNGGRYYGACRNFHDLRDSQGYYDSEPKKCIYHPTIEYRGTRESSRARANLIPWCYEEWLVPEDASSPSPEYWEISGGSSEPQRVIKNMISNKDYVAENTRFTLLRNAVINFLTLNKPGCRAVIDLNGHSARSYSVALDSFVIKSGKLDNSNSIGATVELTNGTVEGDVQIWAASTVTLENVILKHGATFYVNEREKTNFEAAYVNSGMDFGGTVLKQEGEIRKVSSKNYIPYRAVEAGAPRVTFRSNYPEESGQPEQTQTISQTIGQKYQLPAAFAVPTGYVFDHWNTEADGTGERITGQLTYYDTALANIYAVWRRNYVKVTFDRTDGVWKDAASLGVAQTAQTAVRTVPYGKAVGALPTVSRTGYGFAGWYTTKSTGGTLVNAETAVTSDQTYYARWTPADGTKYTVIWQGENIDGSEKELGRAERFGKTNSTVNIDSLKQAFDGYAYSGYTVKHSGNPSGTTGTGTGKTFTVLPDGSVEVTIKYTLKKQKLTVKAQKEDVGKNAASASGVNIGLSTQGHVAADGSTDTKTSMTTTAGGTAVTYYKYGSSVALTAPELTGYTFAGWSGHYTAAGRTVTFPMSDREVVVTALYRQKAYAVEKSLSHIKVEAGGEKVSAPGSGSQTNLSAAGVPYNYTYTLALTAAEGYDLPEKITLRRGTGSEVTLSAGQDKTGAASYTRTSDQTGTVTVKNVTTHLTVTAAAQAKQYTVSFTGQRVAAFTPTGQPVTADAAENAGVSHGSVFVVNMEAEEGYELPDGDGGTLTVTMGGKPLTQGADYTYDSGDGSVCIAEVTGNVEITAAAVTAPSSYLVAYYLQDAEGSYGDTPYETERFYDKKNQDSVSLLETDDTLKADYAKTYNGYAFDREAAGSLLNGTVDADGDLVLKVYYKRSEYRVSIADGYTWADGTNEAKMCRYGAAVELAILEKTGYDAGWSGKYEGSGSGGGLSGLSEKVQFNMPAKNVEITPVYRAQQVAVSEAGLDNVRLTADTKRYGYYEQAYAAKIEPLTGYDLPTEITVKVGGQTLTVGATLDDGDFTYNPADGTIAIKDTKVMGTIEITASGVHQTKRARIAFKNNETADGQAILTADPQESQVPAGEAFNARIILASAGAGYALPNPEEETDSLVVTMGGRTLVYGSDYTYSHASGLIRVPDVVDDVTVTATPTAEQHKADYWIEHYKENLDGSYNLAQRLRREGVVGKTVTAGTAEALLKNYTGYTYDKDVDGTVALAEVKEDGSTTLILYYRRNTCTLTLSAEAGITVEAQVRTSGGVSDKTETVRPDDQKRIACKYGESVTARVTQADDGNSFTGWYQAGEEKGRATSYSMVMTEDLTLTAKSGETRYELVVNGNHGRSTTLTDDCEENIAYGTNKTVGLAPDTGYHLPESVTLFVDGEETDACSYAKEADASAGTVTLTVTGDSEILFQAQPNHYKLCLDADGGTVKLNESDEAKEQVEKEVVYDAAYGSLPEPERAGYTFKGWYTEENGQEDRITEEEIVKRTQDHTLYACWMDETAPVIGTPTYENKAADLWQWVIGKKSLIVHVPVLDEGSGVERIEYTMTPAKDSATAKEAAQTPQEEAGKTVKSRDTKTGTAKVKNGVALITFGEDFKGSISITCTDRAGNAADGVSIGTAGTDGVIVEDRAPNITIAAKESYKGKAGDIQVVVKDDAEYAVTAGLAVVTWQIGDKEEEFVSVGTETLQTEAAFTIPGKTLSTGKNRIRVKAIDNAGNEAVQEVTVLVKEKPGDSKSETEPDDPNPSPEPEDSEPVGTPNGIPPKPSDTEESSMVPIETQTPKPGTAPGASEKTKQPDGIEENEVTQEKTGPDTISGNDAPQLQTPENTGSKRDGKCGLCHICPTFLGICYFIWLLLIILAVILLIWLLRRKKRKEDEKSGKKEP